MVIGGFDRATGWLRLRTEAARALLPRGDSLSDEAWTARHRVIQVLLWIHVAALPVVGALTGNGLAHSAAETIPIAAFALAAGLSLWGRTARAVLATLGLLSSSAMLVHLSGGSIEMHFHFFVMVAIVTLYQSWFAFLVAVGFVAIHHTVIGTLAPEEVFNHPAALNQPWKWALVHAGFIAAQSFAGLVAWRVYETAVGRERSVSRELERTNDDLAQAQSLAHVGSWDWNAASESVWWSDELYRIMGVDPDEFDPDYDGFFDLVHPEDRHRIRAVVEHAYEKRESFELESRVLRPDGEVRTIHVLGRITADAGGIVKMFGSVQDVTERRRLEEQLKHQAFHDPLTGLANRMLFTDRVQHALERLTRKRSTVAVLFVDLDDFKNINDGLGHSSGDELLREMAARLQGVLRVEDTAARLGGDEFAVLIEEADKVGIEVIAQRLLEALRDPVALQGKEIIVNGSVGIAFGTNEVGVEELLRNADTAMYAAKKRGRNRYEFFETEMHSHFVRRLEIQTDLKRALSTDEIVLHFQPICRLDPLEVVGVEALVRWQHPDRGMISPGEFIPMAEETGLILPLGKRVLELACLQIQRWNQTLDREHPVRCGVNFSVRQLNLPNFTEEVARTLLHYGVRPDQLVLEITESVLMHDPDSVAKQLSELADLGMVVAIDDFGTGYSSLSYLRRFPVRVVKIDRYFVRGIGSGPEESAYARAIVKLGHNLNVDVVAEGIETKEELSELVAMGCDFGQGFLFAKPMPGDQLEAMLKNDAELGVLVT